MNGLTLAYLGDAYYELFVRKHFINLGYTNVGILHKMASKCTSGVSQAFAMVNLLETNFLTEDEIDAFKRGRNAHVTTKRKIDLKTYRIATGFEALIGYLSINHEKRCQEVIEKAIMMITTP